VVAFEQLVEEAVTFARRTGAQRSVFVCCDHYLSPVADVRIAAGPTQVLVGERAL